MSADQILRATIIMRIFDFTYEDFELIGYESHPSIAAPIAV